MKPGKLKRNLIIIFSVLLIILVIILILYNVTDIFRTKRGIFFRYFAQLRDIENVLDTSSEYEEYNKTKKNVPYITNGEMKIIKSSNIADESILNKVKLILEGKTDAANEKSSNNITIKSSNKELFNVNIARDKNLYGFYANQIADGYIVLRNKNLNQLAQNMKLENADKIPNQIIPIDIQSILNTSDAEKKHISKYIKMIRDKAPDTAYSKEEKKKIEIEGQKYQTNSATLKLDKEQNANMQIILLEELTSDSVMMNFITSKCKLINLTGECTDINSLNNKMKNRIQTLKENPNAAGELSITIYEYKQKNIQTRIKLDDMLIKISHITIDNKEVVKIEIEEDHNKKTIELQKDNNGHTFKIEKEEDTIIKSAEFIYSITGTVEENNIQNHLTINIVNDIKTISFEYNDKIEFTNDIGNFKEMQDGKVAVINDYDPKYIKDFIDTVKRQINFVYINQAASIGVNLDPIFNVQ